MRLKDLQTRGTETKRPENIYNKRENTSAATTGGGRRRPVLLESQQEQPSRKFGHQGTKLVPVDGNTNSDKTFFYRNAGAMTMITEDKTR